ncbi:MAG: AAA family ATPase [Candidatus Hermodarchaeota archaeon]
MRIQEVNLENFRSFGKKQSFDLRGADILGIVGENGAGKSTLIEALTYGFYGRSLTTDSKAMRKEHLIHDQQSAGKIIIDFQVENLNYNLERLIKRKGADEVSLKIIGTEGKKPLATGAKPTEEVIKRLLGMDYDTFVSSTIIRQGEMSRLSDLNPSQRKDALIKIFGLDRFTLALDKVKETQKELTSEIKSQETEMDRLNNLKTTLEQNEKEYKESLNNINEYQTRKKNLEIEVKRLEEEFEQLQEKEQTSLRLVLKEIEKPMEKLKKDQTILEQGKELYDMTFSRWTDIQKQLPDLTQEIQKRKEELILEIKNEEEILQKRTNKLEQLHAMLRDVNNLPNLEKYLEALERTNRQLEKEIASKSQQIIEVDKQLTKTQNNLNSLEQDPSASTCPLCGQSLNKETSTQLFNTFKTEITTYEEQIKTLTSEITENEEELKKAKADEQQLVEQVRDLRDKKAETKGIKDSQEDVERTKLRLTKLKRENTQLTENNPEHPLIQRKNTLKEQWKTAQADHRKAKENFSLEKLEKTEKEIESLIEIKNELETKDKDHKSRINEILIKIETLIEEKDVLMENLNEWIKIKENVEKKKEELKKCRDDLNGTREDLAFLEGDLERRKKEINDQKEECAILPTKQKEYEEKLEESELNQILINSVFGREGVANDILKRLLPELEREASKILVGLSENRFNGFTIELERETTAGKKKGDLEWYVNDSQGNHALPRFSGGEKFRIHLALRLAISEILSRLTGAMKRPETLIIDEGFGSLDMGGKQAVLQALNYLKKRFAKVIVITHVDDVKESLPSLINVKKDPISNQSQISLESTIEA